VPDATRSSRHSAPSKVKSYSGQISVSGPGIHTSAFVSTRHLSIAGGMLTGKGIGYTGFKSYTLSFTL
jgi:hypothetical protein